MFSPRQVPARVAIRILVAGETRQSTPRIHPRGHVFGAVSVHVDQ